MMTKISLAVALAVATMSTAPAFANLTQGTQSTQTQGTQQGTQVACPEDLGYGRTGSYGC